MIRIALPLDRVICILLLCILAAPTSSFAQDEDPVQVRLMRSFSPRTIVISGNQTLELYSGDPSNPIQRLNAGEKLTITTSNNQVYLRSRKGSIYARSLIVVQDPRAETTIELAEARSIPPPRSYRGTFLIQVDPSTPSTLSIVNEVNMEDYVAAVLASEFNFPELEASKAVAVSIRTMAYRALERQHGPNYAVPDNELWQVYNGTAPITRTVIEAVSATQGEVLRHNDELIEAVYFASSGGHTANNEDVWHASEILPYLRGRDDPYDYNSPHHTWESTINRDRLLKVLSDQYGFKVTGIRVNDRSRDGRARTMLLTGTNNRQERVQSNDFRALVTDHFGRESLKSTLFEINMQPNLYIFTGKGFGHGVGLNQWGALELSKKGNLYDEILAYYYNGIQLNEDTDYGPALASNADTDFYLDDEPLPYNELEDDVFAQDNDVFSQGNAAQIFPADQPASSSSIQSRLFGNEDDIFEEASSQDRRAANTNPNRTADTQQANNTRTGQVLGWSARSTKTSKTRSKRIGW